MNYARFLEHFNNNDMFSIKNGMKLLKMEEGYAETEFDYNADYNNFMGTLHGGALSTMADITAGVSIISFGKICVTLNANINYVKPPRNGKIRAIATVVNHSKRIGTSEVKIYDEENTLVCYCSYIMYITNKDAHF